MEQSNLLIKNIIDKNNISKFSELFNNYNDLAIPLGLALSKTTTYINAKTNTDKINDGVVDNALFEKLIQLVSTDNYKPNITIKEKIINIRNGKQLTKKNKKHKHNKSKKL